MSRMHKTESQPPQKSLAAAIVSSQPPRKGAEEHPRVQMLSVRSKQGQLGGIGMNTSCFLWGLVLCPRRVAIEGVGVDDQRAHHAVDDGNAVLGHLAEECLPVRSVNLDTRNLTKLMAKGHVCTHDEEGGTGGMGGEVLTRGSGREVLP